MKRNVILLALLAAFLADAGAAMGSTNGVSIERLLIIEPSSTPIAAGKATLTIGALHRVGGVYSGDYKIKVSPYFWKSERGNLAMAVSDEAIADLGRGKPTIVVGSATTIGKGGWTRRINAAAKPANGDRGTLKLWFMAGGHEMTFEPAYHFAERATAVLPTQKTQTKLASLYP